MEVAAGIIFIAIISIVLYTYAGYPLVLWILGLLQGKRIRRDESYWPRVVLLISVHNEERIIREKIENSLALDYPKDRFRIVVASDGSVDATNDIVREYEGRGVILKAFDRREGKSATLNRAVLGLEGDVLVFSDANAFYCVDTIRKLVRNMADEEIGCVVGKLVYLTNHSYVGKGESLYWRYESLLNKLESRLRSVLVGTGTVFAVRRSLFKPLIKDVANDFQLPAEVASRGYGVAYESEAVVYERSTFYFREEFSRKRRIIVRGLTGFKALRTNFGGGFRVFQFVSRKLIRWWIGPLLPVLYAANLMLLSNPVLAAVFVLQNAFYVLAAVGAILRRGGVQSRILFVPFYFVMVNAASIAAIATYLGGDRLTSWEKAETTRDTHDGVGSAPRLRIIEGKKQDIFTEKRKGIDKLERIT
ncbi:MAG: glycosyltransferase family 2 protein [Candidatus Krumholzibacteria bacterium]|nr:glycosyltransferase family 2 protein [Candidatus Krumholzibacteria bacterium]